MKELLEYILHTVLEDKTVTIDETEEDGITVFRINAPADQVGRIIGKGGKTINALKNILKIKAIKEGKKIDIQVNSAE